MSHTHGTSRPLAEGPAALALIVSMGFGVGVLATGWHRPSDTVGAYLICVIWFALGTAILLRWRRVGHDEMGRVETRLSPGAATVVGGLVVIAALVALVETFSHDAFHTVEFAVDYLAVSVVILVMAAAIVITYHETLRGVSLDLPDADSITFPEDFSYIADEN